MKVKAKQIALDLDVTLSANSDTRIPSQRAVKAYIDAEVRSGVNEVSLDVTFVEDVAFIIDYSAMSLTEIYNISVYEDTANILSLVLVSTELNENLNEITFYPNNNAQTVVKILGIV